MDQYYYLEGTQQKGPLNINELQNVGLRRDTLVWKNGYPDWVQAVSVPELQEYFQLKVPPPPPAQQAREEARKRETERIKAVQQRNLERMREIKQREKDRLKVLAENITAKGVKARYRLYQVFFWLNVAVVPVWIAALIAVEQAREAYWMHEWVYPEEQIGGFTGYVMNNHIHAEHVNGVAALIFFTLAALTLFARMRFLHYAWSGIQEGETSASPNHAVGFLFIPGYHFIWMFTAYKKLAEDLRGLILDRGYENLELVKPQLAQWFCIFRIGICVPLLNVFAVVPMYVFNALFHKNIKDGLVYALEQKKLQKVEYKHFVEPEAKEAAFV